MIDLHGVPHQNDMRDSQREKARWINARISYD